MRRTMTRTMMRTKWRTINNLIRSIQWHFFCGFWCDDNDYDCHFPGVSTNAEHTHTANYLTMRFSMLLRSPTNTHTRCPLGEYVNRWRWFWASSTSPWLFERMPMLSGIPTTPMQLWPRGDFIVTNDLPARGMPSAFPSKCSLKASSNHSSISFLYLSLSLKTTNKKNRADNFELTTK